MAMIAPAAAGKMVASAPQQIPQDSSKQDAHIQACKKQMN